MLVNFRANVLKLAPTAKNAGGKKASLSPFLAPPFFRAVSQLTGLNAWKMTGWKRILLIVRNYDSG